MKKPKTHYELYLKNLLKRVKRKGLLVQTVYSDFPISGGQRVGYSKYLGAIPVYNLFGKLTNVYEVYEDFDGFIKYYDYPQGQDIPRKSEKRTKPLTGNPFYKLVDIGAFEHCFIQKHKGKLSMEETLAVAKVFEELDQFPASYEIGTVIDQLRNCGPYNHCMNYGQSLETCAAYCEYGRKLQLVMRGGK